MGQWDTGQDIVIDVLGRAGELRGNTRTFANAANSDYFEAAKEYVLRIYRDFLADAPWPFALKDPPGLLALKGEVSGQGSATNGSTTVTLDATIATSMAGRKFKMDVEGVIYRISAHTAGTTILTLDTAYLEETYAGNYTIFQDEYELASDCIQPWDFWPRGESLNRVDFMGIGEMRRRFLFRGHMSTDIHRISIIRNSFPPKVRVTPWTTDDQTLEYEYTYMPSVLDWSGGSTDTPIIPAHDRHVLADGALSLLQEDKEEIDRAMLSATRFTTKLLQMKKTYIQAQIRPRMVPARRGQLGVR